MLALLVSASGACKHARSAGAKPSASKPAREHHVLVVPSEDKNRANPVPPTAKSIESGRNIFKGVCTPCHGEKGNGRGKLAHALDVAPPNLRSAREQDSKTDGELFYIITNGHGDMPAQGDRWNDGVKWDVINFIRTLRRGYRPPVPAPEPTPAAK